VLRDQRWLLAVPAGADRRGQRGAVLMLPHGGGLACRVFMGREPGTGQVLATDPGGGQRGQQGEQRDSRRGQEPAGEPGG
jgi:hypothetical protein